MCEHPAEWLAKNAEELEDTAYRLDDFIRELRQSTVEIAHRREAPIEQRRARLELLEVGEARPAEARGLDAVNLEQPRDAPPGQPHHARELRDRIRGAQVHRGKG